MRINTASAILKTGCFVSHSPKLSKGLILVFEGLKTGVSPKSFLILNTAHYST